MTTTLYCKSTSRAKYLFIVDIRDALLISWHKAHKWLLTKKTWEKTSFALRLLIWADLQNHSEWKEGRGDCEAIHIFGVKYPGCQIIWQVTRASVFTARPSADSKPLRAFGPRPPLHSQIVASNNLQPVVGRKCCATAKSCYIAVRWSSTLLWVCAVQFWWTLCSETRSAETKIHHYMCDTIEPDCCVTHCLEKICFEKVCF